jgi:hypothetical protein
MTWNRPVNDRSQSSSHGRRIDLDARFEFFQRRKRAGRIGELSVALRAPAAGSSGKSQRLPLIVATPAVPAPV